MDIPKFSTSSAAEKLRFTKMHGIGNDYVYIDCTSGSPSNPEALSILLSDRHKGIGGDGIILICPSECADFKMRIFNADGSEAKMCGNGSRCVGKYVYDNGLTDKLELTLETLSGVKYLTLHPGSDGKIETVTVDMGAPTFEPASIPVIADSNIGIPVEVDGKTLKVTAVSMGNPHGVIIVDDLDQTDVHGIGSRLERHPMWPDRANIEFAQVMNLKEIRMRVWERGSGETQACGTGACATAVAASLLGVADSKDVTIHLLGGDLKISRDKETGHIMMTGPATTVFTGEMELPEGLF
ncbi:MAG: diaminopimelate epimerase [Muribaculaceae bacterium]|nr:diaminopimelate epimerase [Muribaculaceae bacterium]MDE6360457.1 diaminopimelate epimerase [Muribaculaceae bacterium]